MWLILFDFREGAVEIEVSPAINRHTPKMDHRNYSCTIRYLDTRYKLLPRLTRREKSTSGDGILGVPQNYN